MKTVITLHEPSEPAMGKDARGWYFPNNVVYNELWERNYAGHILILEFLQ